MSEAVTAQPVSVNPAASMDALLALICQATGVGVVALIQRSDLGERLLAAQGPLAEAVLGAQSSGPLPLRERPWVRFSASAPLPGRPDLLLLLADTGAREPLTQAAQQTLEQWAALAAPLVSPQAAGQISARLDFTEHLKRDLTAAQAALGVYALTELELEPVELMQEAMRLVGMDGNLDWCGVISLRDQQAELVGAWHAPGAADYARTVPVSFPKVAHDWLWWAAQHPEPMTLEHLPPTVREAHLLAPVQGLLTLPLGTFEGALFVMVGLQLSDRGGWRERDLALMKVVARVVSQTVERQSQAEALAIQHSALQYTLNHAPLILWRTDKHGIVVAGQGQGLQALGMSAEGLVGLSALEVYRDAPEVVGNLRRGLAGEAHLGLSSVAGRSYETHYQPLWNAEGVQSGLLGLSYDVTERVQSQQHFEVLFQLSTLLEGLDRLSTVAPQVLATLKPALDVDWLVLWKQDGDTLFPLALYGDPPDQARAMQERGIPVARYLALRHPDGTPVELTDTTMPPEAQGAGLGWAVLAPVCYQNPQQIMVLGVYRQEHGACSAPQLALLETAARVLRAAVVRERHIQTLETHALSDVLTGLGNRRAFQSDLAAGLALSLRHGYAYSVLSLDVDGLKIINDRYGHAAGDRLLTILGRELRAVLRQEDRLYRLGGDEFVALLPHLGPDHPLTLQRRIERALEATRAAGFPEAGLSQGLATSPQDATDAASLMQRSDERLYAEKDRKRAAVPGLPGLSQANLADMTGD